MRGCKVAVVNSYVNPCPNMGKMYWPMYEKMFSKSKEKTLRKCIRKIFFEMAKKLSLEITEKQGTLCRSLKSPGNQIAKQNMLGACS